jgi:hypothetical protein
MGTLIHPKQTLPGAARWSTSATLPAKKRFPAPGLALTPTPLSQILLQMCVSSRVVQTPDYRLDNILLST